MTPAAMKRYRLIIRTLAATALLGCAAGARADLVAVPFDSDQWDLSRGRVVEHLGRPSVIGAAYLKDVEFENGVIEVDVAVNGSTCYPGIAFRQRSAGELETVYIRPHRSGRYQDAVQYTPVFHGVSSWQLYSGEGFTTSADIPPGQWIRLRVEVLGTRARVFLGDDPQPVLLVNDLKHGLCRGAIGVTGAGEPQAYFSDFRYDCDADLAFAPPPLSEPALGMLREWELSQAYPVFRIDMEQTPHQQGLTDLLWRRVDADATGLVDIARHVQRTPGMAECVFARTVIHCDEDRVLSMGFGYSDAVSIFLNGRILFFGNSSYQLRSPHYQGILSLNDYVFLPLRKGENELLLAVAEGFGGWGFMCQDSETIIQDAGLTMLWELPRALCLPESVVYDAEREVLYVSNFFNRGDEFISIVGLDGQIRRLRWITGLSRPTGLCLHGDTLWAVDRGGLVQIDIESGTVLARHAAPDAGFLNDIAVDRSGCAYVSDSERNAILRFKDGQFERWLDGPEITDPNGLTVDGDALIVGISGSGSLKAVDLASKAITTIAELGPGAVMDGVKCDGRGGYIVSDFNGRVFRISPSGQKKELLNRTVPGEFCADLEYVAERGLLIIPSLYGNSITAYRLADD